MRAVVGVLFGSHHRRMSLPVGDQQFHAGANPMSGSQRFPRVPLDPARRCARLAEHGAEDVCREAWTVF